MVHFGQALRTVAAATLLGQAVAHPGHDLAGEIAERNAFYQHSKRDLTHCNGVFDKRGIEDKQRRRRQDAISEARSKRGLPQRRHVVERDTSHLSSLDVSPTTAGVEDIIFSNSSCILSPESTLGPFYVEGEYIRKDIRESQPGVDMVIYAQFIDVSTCKPVPNLMWDIWHTNATGVYGGIISAGNGNSEDASNINATFLRGLQPSDEDGVAQFESIFPGHYTGRTAHIHVVGHLNGVVLDNGTYSGGSIAHIGQIYFDQDLITQVEALSPYTDNKISLTKNVDDPLFASEAANEADPVLNYVLLGESVSDGLFMWIMMGVDTSASYDYSAFAELTADGGVELGGGSGDGRPSGGNSAEPSGTSGVGGASGASSTAVGTATSSQATSGANKCSPWGFFW